MCHRSVPEVENFDIKKLASYFVNNFQTNIPARIGAMTETS